VTNAGRVVALALACALTACYGASSTSQPSPATSTGTTLSPQDSVALERSIDTYLDEADPPGLANVRAVLVSVDGSTVAARYRGSGPDQTGHVWSVTKSVLSVLVGIAIHDGHLRGLDQTVAELLPAYRAHMTPDVASITLQQLLSMTSGLADAPDARVTFDPGDPDIVRTILERPLVAAPGTRWLYSNASPHLVSAALRHATGRSVLDYARTRLFDPLGIRTRPAYEGVEELASVAVFSDEFQRAGFAWGTDRQGVHVGGLMLKLTPADMVKLGELYLAQGSWRGRRIVPAEWVKTSITPVEPTPPNGPSYGLLWWLFELNGRHAYAAIGSSGQGVLVVPDLQLVVAILSRDDGPLPLELEMFFTPLLADVILPELE
jgi:CubicO group peptidase (beta-lactamase class C family)